MSAELIPFESHDTTAAITPVVHFIHITNPLMPAAGRDERTLPWAACKTVAEYLDEVFPLGHELMRVSLNGRMLEAPDRAHVTPRGGDFMVVAPLVQGGNVWRTLAQIGVMAAAVVASVFLGPEFVALGWAASATMGTAMAAVTAGLISLGGGMLINTFMGLSPSGRSQSPSWAFGGPRSLAQPGVVIPKGYGSFQSGGNIIASFVDIEGSNQYINALVCFGFGPARSISNLQINGKGISNYLNVRYYLRMGSNDQSPIPQFNRIVNGYAQQVQVTCDGGPVVVPGTGSLTQALQVDVQFPQGVYYISGAGNQLPCKIVYKVEYALNGTGAWQPVLQPDQTQDVVRYHGDGTVDWAATPSWVLHWTGGDPASGIVLHGDNGAHTAGDAGSVTQTVTLYSADGSHTTSSQTFKGEWQPIDVTVNQVEALSWMDGWVQYVNDTTQAVYNRTSIYGLPAAKYDVRVTKWGSNNADNTVQQGDFDSPKRGQELWIHSVNEITYQDLSYPNMILVGVRALATNQLSGSGINITAKIGYGLRTIDNNILPAALQAFEEDNPACVAADMMLDPLYGGGAYPGIQPTNIERFIDEWVAWAASNDALVPDGNGNNIRLHAFNGIFDNEDNLWNQAQSVARISRASIIPMGRDYGVFVHKADVPVQMFSVGNIKQDSFEETWMALDDRANQVEVEFTDATRNYQTDNPLVYMDSADQAAGAIVKNVRVKGKGITIPAQAWHYGHFLGVCNKLLLRTGKFDADVDAIACRPGNLIILQHDVPEWGWGGRTMPNATASSVTVDRNDLPWDGSTAYNLIVLFPAIQRYTGTVTSAAASIDSTGLAIGTLLNLSSFDNANRVTRAVVNGVDCAILSANAGQVLVTVPPGFAPAAGQAYTLFDTDVLETATVSGVAAGDGNTQVLTLGTPFSQAPEDFSVYFYGQPGSQKIVRVTNIKRLSDERRAIEWIDEDANIYTVGTPIIGATSAKATTNPGVTSLTAAEVLDLVNNTYVDNASLSWVNGPDTHGVAIFGSYPGLAQPKLLGHVTGYRTVWKFPISPLVSWTFTVVGFDANGYFASFATAPSVTLTGAGVTANLLRGSTFQSGFTYWNVSNRTGDTIACALGNSGQCDYMVAGTSVTSNQTVLSQLVPPSLWSIGTDLILSAYFETTGTPTGNLVADICFKNSGGGIISTARAALVMAGAASGLARAATAPTAVPSGTDAVYVRWLFDGSGLNLPAGTVLSVSHLLLEVPQAGQALPSVWADLDVQGHVIDTFQIGSSSSLRTQASSLPITTGQIAWSATATTLTITWSGLVIAWPDGGFTQIQDGTFSAITGLSASTQYWVYLFWDVVNAALVAAVPSTPVGTPGMLSVSADANALASCRLDGRICLIPGGGTVTTPASGTTTGYWGTAGAVFPRPHGGPILPAGGRT